MGLTEKIKEALLKDISNSEILLHNYDAQERDFVRHLLASGVLKESEIDSALESAVISRAAKDYDFLVNSGRKLYPDHDVMPEYLAYAIKHLKLPPNSDANKIKFDHGETPETFAKLYCPDNLLANLRNELLNPKPLPVYDDSERVWDPHPVCLECD